MEKKQVGDLVSVTFTWRIEKFSRLRPQKHYSDSFAVGDFKWQIVVYPKGSSGNPGKHDLSIYLNVADATTLSSGWSRYAQFTLTVVNQLDSDKSITFVFIFHFSQDSVPSNYLSALGYGVGCSSSFSLTEMFCNPPLFDCTETKHVFSASKSDWGFTSFMPLSELSDCTKGFLVNDACVLEAEVAVSQVDYTSASEANETLFFTPIKPSENENERQGRSNVDAVQFPQVLDFLDSPSFEQKQTNADSLQAPISSKALTTSSSYQVLAFQEEPSSEQYCPEPNDSPVESPIVKEHELARSTPLGELMDFRGLGKIDKDYVPFLEEVCLLHPSLIECQRKRSRVFTEWAFTALGRLLHFLKTTKGKDMIEAPCEEHLQLLWEELGTFKFDLAWLEPHVQSALGMKKFVERERHVTKLRNNVDALDIEIKRLKAWLTVAEVEFVDAKTDMGEAEESFVAINMDSELGYGGWH
ncbi:uncharacterized protein [Malus domestica]|uniref:uncharacterized protein isoform X1 n=1 Tax=Malus domestica TaxID=3750 RepID=UPI0010AB4B1C|nr:uncharacterized protein LOC103438638 isoform X1 [Malus domestica]